MNAQEKLADMKKKFSDQKELILKQMIKDVPVMALAAQPGLALQLILGLRSTLEILKELDKDYVFTSDQLPSMDDVKTKQEYVG